jgi:hypothetical protein
MNKITAYERLLQIPEDCSLDYPDYLPDRIVYNFRTYNWRKTFSVMDVNEQ